MGVRQIHPHECRLSVMSASPRLPRLPQSAQMGILRWNDVGGPGISTDLSWQQGGFPNHWTMGRQRRRLLAQQTSQAELLKFVRAGRASRHHELRFSGPTDIGTAGMHLEFTVLTYPSRHSMIPDERLQVFQGRPEVRGRSDALKVGVAFIAVPVADGPAA